jgi:peptidoglycan/xylan/chitin deacetylase (PgdA/CDA1 family)
MIDNKYATHWRQAVSKQFAIVQKSRAFLRDVVLLFSSLLSMKTNKKFLRCLFCHYVFDDQIKNFEFLILELKKIGEFVDTDTCIKMVLGNRKIDKPYFHLSFDDGFRNNFTNALPILIKHKVPAIFFVPSTLIEANWSDTYNYCLKKTGYSSVIEMLRWSDLREMLKQGYDIGSHTKTHSRFSDISNNKSLMNDEIMGSKQELEANLDYECKYISWPYGRIIDVDGESLRNVKSAGYTACFSACRGTVLSGVTDIFMIPRHHFEVQWPLSFIKYFARGNMEGKASHFWEESHHR